MPNSPEQDLFRLWRAQGAGLGVDPVVRFQDRRTVLAASNRVTWRLSLLVLVVAKCRGQTASFASLHLLMWGLRSSHANNLLTSWLTGQVVPDLVTSRMDPLLDTTVRLAVAEGLVEVTSTGRVKVLERGKELAALIDADNELLKVEKDTLRAIAPLSDTSLAQRMGGRFNDN